MSGGREVAMTLADLAPGGTATVIGMNLAGPVRNRLMEMGMTIGQRVTLRRKAPLGGPLAVELRGYYLALRLAEARRILVESTPEGDHNEAGQ